MSLTAHQLRQLPTIEAIDRGQYFADECSTKALLLYRFNRDSELYIFTRLQAVIKSAVLKLLCFRDSHSRFGVDLCHDLFVHASIKALSVSDPCGIVINEVKSFEFLRTAA